MALLSTFTDDFNDNTEDVAKWGNSYNSSATRAETNGQAYFTLSDTGSHYSAYASTNTYNLTKSYAFVQVPVMCNTNTAAEAFMTLHDNGNNNNLEIMQEAGLLYFRQRVSGTTTNLYSIPYSQLNHQWWRIRESSGTIFWETSPDGFNWKVQYSKTTPIAIGALYVDIGAGTYQVEVLPGGVAFDNFNLYPSDSIDKTYNYKWYSQNSYKGLLNNVISEFNLNSSINTAGSQIEIDLGISLQDADPELVEVILADEEGNEIVDEDSNQIAISQTYTLGTVPNLNDKIEVWEYDGYHPEGKLIFQGLVSKWAGSYKDSIIKLTVLSYGVRLSNVLIQTLAGANATENAIDLRDATEPLYTNKVSYSDNTAVAIAQTFQVSSNTSVGSIRVKATRIFTSPTVEVFMDIYVGTPSAPGSLLATTSVNIGLCSDLTVEFAFTPVSLSASTTYHFKLYTQNYTGSGSYPNPRAYFGKETTGTYASGAKYTQNDVSGWSAASTSDLVFEVVTASDTVGKQFNSTDPSNMVRSLIDDFQALGGNTSYDTGSITSSGTTVSYSFKTDTYLDGLQKAIELAPSRWWWYVDPASNIIYMQPLSSEPDHVIILGKHLDDLSIEYSLENMANRVYFSGGDTGAGENLTYSTENTYSVSQFGGWLEVLSDNRVTLADTAEILSTSILNEKSKPRFMTTISIPSSVYDTSSFRIGQIIGFSNFNSLIDSLKLQIFGISYTPNIVSLTLEILPPSVSKRVEDIKRNLLKQETENNPDA